MPVTNNHDFMLYSELTMVTAIHDATQRMIARQFVALAHMQVTTNVTTTLGYACREARINQIEQCAASLGVREIYKQMLEDSGVL